jgi:hypothetical protein
MRQPSLFDAPAADRGDSLAAELDRLDATVDDSVRAVREKAARYRTLRDAAEAERARFDLWTAAFFQPLTPANARNVPTTKDLLDTRLGDIKAIQAAALASEAGFFHWELEFPQVFGPTNDQRPMTNEQGRSSLVVGRSSGFDVVLGNPPWERIKLQDKEHWADVPEIRDAANKTERDRRILAWRRSANLFQQERVAQYDRAIHITEAESQFMRISGNYPLTATGDFNTYALFAERARSIVYPMGQAGLRGRLENQDRRDTMIGLCIGMRQPRCYDGILDRLNRRAVGLDRTDFPATGRPRSSPNRQFAARD